MCGPNWSLELHSVRQHTLEHPHLVKRVHWAQSRAIELAADNRAWQFTKRSERAERRFTCKITQMSDHSDFEKEQTPKKSSGQADSKHAYMKPEERDAMVEWLGMDREGQKDGQPMKNWRSIYGGAAKGRSMNEDADEVHAKGGYQRLAAHVNTKCKIKSDRKRAWDEEVAEKRWTALKKNYRKACRMQAPLNTNFETDEAFADATKQFESEREKCCLHFQKIHNMLKDHPGMHPHQPTDSMAQAQAGRDAGGGEHDEPEMRGKDDTMGITKKRKEDGSAAAAPKKKKVKEEFHLRKPGGAESATKKRMSIHEMFIESQMKQTELEKQKLMVEAVGKLAAANIAPANMGEYLKLMGLGASASDPVSVDSSSDSDQ
jgi:hypothetical protein